MEQTHPRATEKPGKPGTSWLTLILEALVVCAIAAVLALVTLRLPDGRSDAGFVFAIALGLHAAGVLRFTRRLSEFLELECPSCRQSFHDFPERLPRPLRHGCAHCGARLS
jgi:hypothetical protein